MAAVIAYFREGGITSADRDRIVLDARAICARRAKIPADQPRRHAVRARVRAHRPAGPGAARVSLSARHNALGLSAVLMALRQHADRRAGRRRDPRHRAAAGGRRDGVARLGDGEAGFEAEPQRGGRGDRDETLLLVTVGGAARAAAGADPPLAARRARPARGGRASRTSSPRASRTGSWPPGSPSVSGQTTAILIVLMFGVGTDYCLLIVARFRETSSDAEEGRWRRCDGARGGSGRRRPSSPPARSSVVAMLTGSGWRTSTRRARWGPILALGVADHGGSPG